MYKKDYYEVSNAIFQVYDEGKLSVGDKLESPPYSRLDMDKITGMFSSDIVNRMKKLNKSAGVYDYIVANKDVIYFSFGASLQSIDGQKRKRS